MKIEERRYKDDQGEGEIIFSCYFVMVGLGVVFRLRLSESEE